MMSELKRVLSQHHAQQMRGKLGGSAMCICGQGCGSTEACGEYAILLRDLTTATAKIEALEAKLAAAEKLCDAEVFAVVYSNYDPLEIDSLWATEQLAIDHRDRLNDSMWTVVRMTVHSTPYTADEENTDA